MKNGSCPSGVIVASGSPHPTRTGPKKQSRSTPSNRSATIRDSLARPVSPKRRSVALHALEEYAGTPPPHAKTKLPFLG